MPHLSNYRDFYAARRARRMRENPNFDPELVVVSGDGPTPCQVMLIGERPGKDEPWHEEGGVWCPKPFVGAAGKELDRYLRIAGLSRDQVYVTNLVKTYVDADPEEWEVVRDEDLLIAEIEHCGPTIIVPLGAYATKRFLGLDATMEKVAGLAFAYTQQCWLLPIWHPAAGLHDPENIKFIVDGFERLGRMCRGDIAPIIRPVDAHPQPIYAEPDLGGIWWHKSEPVGIDTEGSRRDPICLTYSRFPGEGRIINAEQKWLLERIQVAINVGAKIVLHNSLHDLEVLDSLGISLPEGGYIDTMILAYLLCLEPQGLKALAYRRAGMEMQDYDEVIHDASRAKALEYLRMLDQYDWGEAESWVEMKCAKGKLVAMAHQPHSLNKRITRILSDVEKKPETDARDRWSGLTSKDPGLARQAIELCGPMPEATLRDVPENIRRYYACRDADATIRIFPGLIADVINRGLERVLEIDHAILPMVNRMQHVGIHVDVGHFQAFSTRLTKEADAIQAEIKQVTGWWINPDSGDQCAALLFGSKADGGLGLPWTKYTKSKSRPRCDDKVLESLRGSHPVVSLITDYRERTKLRDSFCTPIVLYAERESDTRLRCNLRVTRVSSGRLAANTPNLLAIPTRSELGLEIRKGFVAEPGHLIGDVDLDQIEMREMAHQSQEPLLIEIFNDGKRDVHNETGALVFGCKPSDITKFQRLSAKRVGFGVITGITGMGLLDQIQMALAQLPDEERRKQQKWDEEECDRVIAEWFKVYPKVREFMEACRCEARRYGYVRDRWGRMRYLPGIHSSIKHVREEAERQSHSFKISASAQGIMKIGMKLVWDNVIKPFWKTGVYIEPLLQVHDSQLVEAETELWEGGLVDTIGYEFTKADPTFSVPVKYKGGYGPTWGDLEK